MKRVFFFCFFFQAEDGIRDLTVTGVQTCALPISTGGGSTKTWSAAGLSLGLTLSPAGVLSGTPTGNGFSTFAVTVTDGITPVTQRMTLFIRLPNPALLSFPPFNAILPDTPAGQEIGI